MSQPPVLYFEIYRDGKLIRTDQSAESAIKLGSHPKSHVHLDDPEVGRAHAMVEKTEAGVFIIDLGSGRGTTVNGERVNKRGLKHRDRITLGTTEVVFLTHDEKAAAAADARHRLAIDPATNRPRDEVLYARRFLARPAATDGSVEVALLFNDFVMAEEIYQPPVDVTVGPSEAATFQLEHASLGADHVLISGGGQPTLNVLPWMEGEVYVGAERKALGGGGASSFPLTDDTRAKVVVGDVKFFIHRSTKPAAAFPWERREAAPLLFTLFSLGLHVLFMLVLMFLPPGVAGLAMDAFGAQDRFVQILIEDPEPEPEPEVQEEEVAEEEGETTPEGEEGRLGQEDAPDRDTRLALPGDLPPGEIELARATEAVQDRGALAVLNMQGPAALFGTGPSGSDALMAIGGTTGDAVGSSYGSLGLGSYGGGLGGGGRFTGGALGGGPLSLRGGRAGGDGTSSLGQMQARLSDRAARVPTVQISGDARIEGQLDREIIQRVVREHRREIVACYESELVANPDLEGRVVVSFVIAADGQVAGSRVAESTLGNPTVESCVTTRVRRWRFPEPRGGGTVNVNYPFVFTAGG